MYVNILEKMSIFQHMYVNISKKCQYFNKFMSIFQKMSIFQQMYVNISKNVNISINLCQNFKKCQYFNKCMSIFQKYVNSSSILCQYFIFVNLSNNYP